MNYMPFDFRFMTLNKILRNRRNIEEKIRWYTYKATSISASNSPRELDFVLNDSYDNVLYPFLTLLMNNMNICFVNLKNR